LEQYADAVRAVLPDDLSEVVLVGYSFGGFTATLVALDYPGLPDAAGQVVLPLGLGDVGG
jgi:pimeloyl-ACP methyl ester carboxylesterase